MKLKLSILEDEPIEIDYLKSLLDKWSLQAKCELEISAYRSGEDFFEKNDKSLYKEYSAILLDIQMEGMNGLDAAKRLRKEGYKEAIIFITSFRDFVFDGYNVHALHYLLKPVEEKPLFLCLDEILKSVSGDSYLYKGKTDTIYIPNKDILTFSTGFPHCVDILTTSGTFRQYTTLNKIMYKLPREFIRTHRSYIVNMAHICKISGSVITLSNDMRAEIGRTYLTGVTDKFSAYSSRFDSCSLC